MILKVGVRGPWDGPDLYKSSISHTVEEHVTALVVGFTHFLSSNILKRTHLISYEQMCNHAVSLTLPAVMIWSYCCFSLYCIEYIFDCRACLLTEPCASATWVCLTPIKNFVCLRASWINVCNDNIGIQNFNTLMKIPPETTDAALWLYRSLPHQTLSCFMSLQSRMNIGVESYTEMQSADIVSKWKIKQ